jgi:molybdopterin-containing oxidoreductase family membrane subunit
VLSGCLGLSLHLVTAFLYAGLSARPYWHSALLGPRVLATAFAAGPALMIIILAVIRRHTTYAIAEATLQKLALVVTVAATALLSVHGLRRTSPVLYLACAMLFVGVLIDKGIGTIIPGFVPSASL